MSDLEHYLRAKKFRPSNPTEQWFDSKDKTVRVCITEAEITVIEFDKHGVCLCKVTFQGADIRLVQSAIEYLLA